jgi:membrane associated rhomboid family serine protease
VGLLAVVTTLLWMADYNIDIFTLNMSAFGSEPWRLLTSALPHLGVFHLLFNLYWLWTFGTRIEQEWGHARTFGLFAALAIGSGAAEYALFSGGVGLSGVGYGLFGLLWVAGRRDPRFADAVDSNTAMLFGGWFFLCIAATAADIMPVANVAHGAGALLGGLIGFAVSSRKAQRYAFGILAAASLALMVASGALFRPTLNISGGSAATEIAAGDAFDRGEYRRALKLYQEAVADYGESARLRYNVGVSFSRLGQHREAAEAYEKAHQLAPKNSRYRKAAKEVREHLELLDTVQVTEQPGPPPEKKQAGEPSR